MYIYTTSKFKIFHIFQYQMHKIYFLHLLHILYARSLLHYICVGISMGSNLSTIYDYYINYVFPLYIGVFFHIIYLFIYVNLWHFNLNEIYWSCWNLVNDALINFCLWHLLFPIRSRLVIIMPVAIHMIWLVYARVMTLQIINLCIMY
jgi:hypothetical protein